MRRLFLCDCAAGDTLEDVFVLTNKQLAATATGKYFIKAFVSDRSSQLTARLWNATRDIFNALPDSGFVKLRGRVENYQNNLQLIIEQLWPAKQGTFEIADLIPHTQKDIPAMRQRLVQILLGLRNRYLAAIAAEYLNDEPFMEQFCQAPAAMSFHHAFIGGLLEHTLNSIEVALAIAGFYPGLNADLLVLGLFLHDIAKVWELKFDCAFGYTDGGQLVGHIVKSAIWLEQRAAAAEARLQQKMPPHLVEALQHIIISHHGQPEFGAVKTPATPEAIAVHYIENLDAKLMISLGATRGDTHPGSEGNWSEFVKSLGGRLFRPDPAPLEPIPDVTAAVPPTPTTPATPAMPATPAPDQPVPAAKITNPLFAR